MTGEVIIFTICIVTWTKEWIDLLSEVAASVRIEMNSVFHIIKGEQALLIIHKHSHFLELLFYREGDFRVSISQITISFPQLYGPVTVQVTGSGLIELISPNQSWLPVPS